MRKIRIALCLLSLTIFAGLLEGCASARYSTSDYTVSQGFTLDNIERDSESFIPITEDICYVDRLRFYSTFDGIRTVLQVKNESGSSVKVLWDDGAIIDQENVTHRIIHAGIKIIDKEKAQVPSVIPDNTILEETIYGAEFLQWNAGKGDWDYLPIVWDKTFNDELSAENYIRTMAPVKLMLPIEKNGELIEYMITFKESGSLTKARSHVGLSTGSIIAIGLAGSLVTGLLFGLLNSEVSLSVDL